LSTEEQGEAFPMACRPKDREIKEATAVAVTKVAEVVPPQT